MMRIVLIILILIHINSVNSVTLLPTSKPTNFPTGILQSNNVALIGPQCLAMNSVGLLFVSDQYANKVYKIDPITKELITLPIVFNQPSSLWFDSSGYLYVSEAYYISKVDVENGISIKVAGSGDKTGSIDGDGMFATDVSLTFPGGIVGDIN
eukprot:gene17534-24309_t